MTRRLYLATDVGAFNGLLWGGCVPGTGRSLVRADVSPAQHTTLVGTVGVTYVPIEDAGANPVDLVSGTIGDVSAANRGLISTRLEAEHIPTQDFTLTTSIAEAHRRILRRLVLRQLLGVDDWNEGLDTLISAIAATRRNAIAAKLQSWGFDTSVIAGTDTVREAIRKIASQLPRVMTVAA